jgi:hypothetical protein
MKPIITRMTEVLLKYYYASTEIILKFYGNIRNYSELLLKYN